LKIYPIVLVQFWQERPILKESYIDFEVGDKDFMRF